MSNVKSMNTVMLVGRLGSEPQVKTYEFGAIASFSVATTKGFKDKNGQWQESTTWVPCSIMGAQAENAAKFLHKGDLVCVMGSISVRETTTEAGKRQYIDVRVGEIQVLARSNSTNAQGATQSAQDVKEVPTSQTSRQPAASAPNAQRKAQLQGGAYRSPYPKSGYQKRAGSNYQHSPIPADEIPDL